MAKFSLSYRRNIYPHVHVWLADILITGLLFHPCQCWHTSTCTCTPETIICMASTDWVRTGKLAILALWWLSLGNIFGYKLGVQFLSLSFFFHQSLSEAFHGQQKVLSSSRKGLTSYIIQYMYIAQKRYLITSCKVTLLF